MASDVFQEIIELEKQIRGRLAKEKDEAAEWLARRRAEIGQEVREQLDALGDAACRDTDQAHAQARREAAEILEQAERDAARLDGLDNGKLRKLIRAKINLILPGQR